MRSYWEKRFMVDPQGWGAAGDRNLSEQQNLHSAVELMDRMAGVLQRTAGPLPGRRLLDAGCGYGNFTDMARQMGFDALGVDFSHSAVEQARRRYPTSRFQVADLARLRLAGRFDVILTVNVLVAMVEDGAWRRALARFTQHLTEGGTLVVFETLQQPDDNTERAAHVRFRSLDEYRDTLRRCRMTVRHHERVYLQAEQRYKDLVVAGRT